MLKKFREFLMTPGRMLCFFGPDLEKHKAALGSMAEKGLIVEEEFKGAYSLTRSGFEAIQASAK